MGFKMWVTSGRELASHYNLPPDSELDVDVYKQKCQEALDKKNILDGQLEINHESKHQF